MLEDLVRRGMLLSELTCVGHSLGAHIPQIKPVFIKNPDMEDSNVFIKGPTLNMFNFPMFKLSTASVSKKRITVNQR